jgi:hypothetical protein
MAKYYRGFEAVRGSIAFMNEEELLEQLDGLLGRGYLPAKPSLAQLRAEVTRQACLDWLDPDDPNYAVSRRILEQQGEYRRK